MVSVIAAAVARLLAVFCRHRPLAGLPLGGLLMLLAACQPGTADDGAELLLAGTPPRAGRFGSLRDLVLLERTLPTSAARGTAWLFVDRFEVTRADWAAFASSSEGQATAANDVQPGSEPTLPMGRLDLRQARAFARWRFCRLPRAEEWVFATAGDGRHLYPWGGNVDATRANSGELGVLDALPVGSFESGRRAIGWPYDLVGNVSEWTESVPWAFCQERGDTAIGVSFGRLQQQALRQPALAVWQLPGGLLPPMWVAELGGELVPREVVGADFQTSMNQLSEAVLAGDRRQRTGLRLYSTPAELLVALLQTPAVPTASDAEQLRRFVRRGRHREVLLEAARDGLPGGNDFDGTRPVAKLLQAELFGNSSPTGGR